MKQIKNNFANYYYLTIDGKVYNNNTDSYVKIDKHSYKLKTTDGKLQSISLKRLYKLVYNKVFCIDDIQDLEGEKWAEIEDTSQNYYISNYGRIKSYMKYEATLLKPSITRTGYERLQISQNGLIVNKLIHRLVAQAFLQQPSNIDMEIHHIDGNTRNNKANNLKWVTVAEHQKIHYETDNRKENKDNGKTTKPKDDHSKQSTRKQTKPLYSKQPGSTR